MSIVKNLGKSLLIAGIFMLLAAPVMAKGNPGKGAHLMDGSGEPKCTCCDGLIGDDYDACMFDCLNK
nr:hypothetical protein [uncultured Desulfobulbus sp.]